MLGHEDIRPESKLQFNADLVHSIGQPLAGSLRLQKGIPLEARKGKFMGMARLIDGFTSLSAQTPVHLGPPFDTASRVAGAESSKPRQTDSDLDASAGASKTQPRPAAALGLVNSLSLTNSNHLSFFS